MSIPTLHLNECSVQFLNKYSMCLLGINCCQNVKCDTVEQVAFLLGAVNPQIVTNDSKKSYLVADYFSAIQPEIEKLYHIKDFLAEATYQGIKTYSLYISTDIFPNNLLAGMSDKGCYIEYSEAKTVNYNNYQECLEHIKDHFDFSQLGDSDNLRALTFDFPGCWWLTYMFYRPEDSWVGNGYQVEEFRKIAQNISSLELASNIRVLYSCPEYTEWLTLSAIWQNNQWLLSFSKEEKLRQSLRYAAVLGGKSKEAKPRPYDVVIGGKQSVDQAIQALKDPNTYEQAKKILLAQPKTENPLLKVKAKSWGDIFRFYSEHIEIHCEKPEGYERYYGYDFPVAYYYFTIPEVADNPLTYHKNQYGTDLDTGHRACFKSAKWICSRLSQASNFRYLTDRWSYNSQQILIGNYWDADRQKMILLP